MLVFSLFSSRKTDERVQMFENDWNAPELGFCSVRATGQLGNEVVLAKKA